MLLMGHKVKIFVDKWSCGLYKACSFLYRVNYITRKSRHSHLETEQASSTNLYIENGPYRSGNALKRQRMLGRK